MYIVNGSGNICYGRIEVHDQIFLIWEYNENEEIQIIIYYLCINLCKELEEFSGEPFAIAISGEWGSGKTSFVNALKGKLKQVEFVNVECVIEYDIKAVLRELSSQLQEIYQNNNVYTERNGAIDKYLKK